MRTSSKQHASDSLTSNATEAAAFADARLHQGHGRFRKARRSNRRPAQESDPHVRPAWQSASQEPVQCDWLPAKARRRELARLALIGPRRRRQGCSIP